MIVGIVTLSKIKELAASGYQSRHLLNIYSYLAILLRVFHGPSLRSIPQQHSFPHLTSGCKVYLHKHIQEAHPMQKYIRNPANV